MKFKEVGAHKSFELEVIELEYFDVRRYWYPRSKLIVRRDK